MHTAELLSPMPVTIMSAVRSACNRAWEPYMAVSRPPIITTSQRDDGAGYSWFLTVTVLPCTQAAMMRSKDPSWLSGAGKIGRKEGEHLVHPKLLQHICILGSHVCEEQPQGLQVGSQSLEQRWRLGLVGEQQDLGPLRLQGQEGLQGGRAQTRQGVAEACQCVLLEVSGGELACAGSWE